MHLIDDPILDQDLPNTTQKIVQLLTTCGDDGCRSDLRINGSVPEEIVVGQFLFWLWVFGKSKICAWGCDDMSIEQ